MKRWLFLITTLVLLTGCSTEEEIIPTTEPSLPVTPAATEPTGYYDPDSELEASSEGAVRVYPLNRSDSYGLVTIGDDLLLLSGNEVTTLTRLTGNTLYVSAAANLDCYVDADSPAFRVSEKGVTYYDEAHRQLVFLDSGLKEGNRVSLPETILGEPALSADRKQLYYFTANHLRCLDLETGLDRMIKEIFFPVQSIKGLHLNDTVVECSVADEEGNRYGLFFSVQTGETLWETMDDDVELITSGQAYYAVHMDGIYPELLIGAAGQDPILLTPKEYEAHFTPVTKTGGIVMNSVTDDTVTLSYYDLETGTRPYALSLPEPESDPENILGDPDGYYIWFLRYDAAYGSDTLCRWELAKTVTDDKSVYTSSRYTYENPDLEGIALCKAQASAIGKKYGVDILLWTDAVAYQPEDYWMSAEYQAPLISRSLEQLDKALSRYPDGFLKKTASGSADGKIKICLVRSISGDADANVPAYSDGLQYWDGLGHTYIAVTPGNGLEHAVFRELFHIIDSKVISNCSLYDDWSKLNPKDFEYTYNPAASPVEKEDLLEGKGRAFTHPHGMISPKEDRARIMEYAMDSDSGSCFESDIMQAKLRKLCQGIRKAYKLEKSKEALPWEQHLTKPLNG